MVILAKIKLFRLGARNQILRPSNRKKTVETFLQPIASKVTDFEIVQQYLFLFSDNCQRYKKCHT